MFFSWLGLLSFGFLLGLQHALEADHIAAVSTIVSQTKSLKRSSFLGILWGLGHTSTLLLVGTLVLLFKLTIPDKVALSLEFLVGIMLVILGGNLLWKLWNGKLHNHVHTHDGMQHAHLHSHLASSKHRHLHRSFFVGLIHGLAGSGALTLLVLASVESTGQGILFMMLFGIGSVLGMLLVSFLIGIPVLFASRFAFLEKSIQMFSGAVSLLIGLHIVYTIGVVEKLFF